ncbi:MAG: hypothetical protein HYZ92_01380 [Candidatus Omnitrophica bacterium]|nr:hypothetical protein [Candidatus Omnitrophota bacterium]
MPLSRGLRRAVAWVLMAIVAVSYWPVPRRAWATGGVNIEEPPPPPPPPSNGGGDPPPPPPPSPPEVWEWYGFAYPQDPNYRFIYPDPSTTDLLGLSAKGNIVIGDYTAQMFKDNVVPKLRPGQASITQAYAVDPTDAQLGYVSYTDARGLPIFDGNYDNTDGGKKWNGTGWIDGSTRKFYESSLTDEQFHALTCCNWDGTPDPMYHTDWSADIDAVLFTNHAAAGLVLAEHLYITGALVARDDALMFNKKLGISHDIRLLDKGTSIVLPVALKRPELVSWKEINE